MPRWLRYPCPQPPAGLRSPATSVSRPARRVRTVFLAQNVVVKDRFQDRRAPKLMRQWASTQAYRQAGREAPLHTHLAARPCPAIFCPQQHQYRIIVQTKRENARRSVLGAGTAASEVGHCLLAPWSAAAACRLQSLGLLPLSPSPPPAVAWSAASAFRCPRCRSPPPAAARAAVHCRYRPSRVDPQRLS